MIQAFIFRHLLADNPGDHSRVTYKSLTPNPQPLTTIIHGYLAHQKPLTP